MSYWFAVCLQHNVGLGTARTTGRNQSEAMV
jgi:hypothetical protein